MNRRRSRPPRRVQSWGVSAPSATWKNWPRPRQRVEQAGLGPGQPGLGAEVGEHGQQLRAAPRVEMGGDFVQEQHRQIAPAPLPQPRLGEEDADQIGLLPAGGAARGGLATPGVGGDEVAAVRPDRRAAGLRRPRRVTPASVSARRCSTSTAGSSSSHSSSSPSSARCGRGKWCSAPGRARRPARRPVRGARRSTATAGLGHPALDRAEPGRVAAAGAQQVRALARRTLVTGDARRVRGIDASAPDDRGSDGARRRSPRTGDPWPA